MHRWTRLARERDWGATPVARLLGRDWTTGGGAVAAIRAKADPPDDDVDRLAADDGRWQVESSAGR